MDYGLLDKLLKGISEDTDKLSINVVNAAGRITDAAASIKQTVSELNATIKSAGDSATNQARSMRKLTFLLVIVGFVGVFAPIIYSQFVHRTYIICTQSNNEIVCKE